MKNASPDILRLYRKLDPPIGADFEADMLGDEAAAELATVSRLWFACGYRPGIAAYLNFFLLADFIETHDRAKESRFRTFRSMSKSFYETDLFIRDVTDSGPEPSPGIASDEVRAMLASIMKRHQTVGIPLWMMTYFGFSLTENVEQQVEDISDDERRLHLQYMNKTYRIMGVPFSQSRELMQEYCRTIEARHAGSSPNLAKHARHILLLGEMVGAPSSWDKLAPLLPVATREVMRPLHAAVRPGVLRRVGARVLGRVLIPRAVGKPRTASV